MLELFRIYADYELRPDGYPVAWPAIAYEVKRAANFRCMRCDSPSIREIGKVLTVHHYNGRPADCTPENLVPLCQKCHLVVQNHGWLTCNYPRGQTAFPWGVAVL